MTRLQRELLLVSTVVVLASAVAVLGLHRAGLYALPGDRIAIWFPTTIDKADALQRIGRAGAVVDGSGPLPGLYRIYVVDAAAPRRLVEEAWLIRDPIDGLAQCFGLDTGGPNQPR